MVKEADQLLGDVLSTRGHDIELGLTQGRAATTAGRDVLAGETVATEGWPQKRPTAVGTFDQTGRTRAS